MSYQPKCPDCGCLENEGHSKECAVGTEMHKLAARERDAAKEIDARRWLYGEGYRSGFQEGYKQGMLARGGRS